VFTRGGGEDTTFEAMVKDSDKVRGQGQGPSVAEDRLPRGQGQKDSMPRPRTRGYV